MESFVPHLVLSAALVFAACSTPEQRAAAHQRQLQEEAREKFSEQKEQERERAEEVANARKDAAEDARKRAEEVTDARRRAAEDAARYRAYEAEYARQLGKKPSQLTPAERAWVREHF
jgi:hypothetical protein